MIDASTLCLGCFETAHVGSESCPYCGWENSRQSRGMHLEPGQELHHRYILGRVLGQGGFGITYLGFDQTLNTKVAVKEYLYTTWASRLSGTISVQAHTGKEEDFASGVASFLAEARILAQFKQHHNIVTVTDFFKANGTGYLVMDFEEGITFKQHLSDQADGKLPWLQALPIFIQVMDALRAAHTVNLIHRDISPDNIYLTKNGVVKVLDFGNARHFDAEKSQSFSAVLKEGYAPPEQYSRKGKQGPWTDVYSLGATMYNALTGEKPPQAMDRKEEDELKPIKSLIPDLPDGLAKLIHKALSLKASDRYQTIADMAQALMELRRNTGGFTPPQPPTNDQTIMQEEDIPIISSSYNSNRKYFIYVILAVLILIIGDGYLARQPTDSYTEESLIVDPAPASIATKSNLQPIMPVIPKARLTVMTVPADADVRILEPAQEYHNGMEVPPGHYQIEVSRKGYQSKKETLQLSQGDQTHHIDLVKEATKVAIRTTPVKEKVKVIHQKKPSYPRPVDRSEHVDDSTILEIIRRTH